MGLILLALVGTSSAQIIFDFYPNGTGDQVTWANTASWWRYTTGDAGLYPREVDGGVRGNWPGDATFYGANAVYIRQANTVTIGSGTTGISGDLRIGTPTFEDAGGSLVSFGPSTLTIKAGGTLNNSNGTGVTIGGYGGTLNMEPGSVFLNQRWELGSLGETSTLAASTGVWNQTGGSFWAGQKTFIGHVRGVGIYNMSGGTAGFNFFHLGTTGTGGTVAGQGYATITGGYIHSREVYVGFSEEGAGCWGELNLLGGTWAFIGSNGHQGGQSGFSVEKGIVRVGKGFRQDFSTPGLSAFDDEWYTQGPNGQLEIEVKDADEFGYLAFQATNNPWGTQNFGKPITTGVWLEGTFDVTVPGDADFGIGDTFRVLTSKSDSLYASTEFLDSYNTITGRYFNISVVDDGATKSLLLTAIKAAGGAPPHPGDANNDGFVDVGDLGILAFNWCQSPRAWAQGNFTTPDTVVDVGDLGVLAFNWGWIGTPAGADSVPEPVSLAVLAIGGLLIARRRR